MVGEGIRELTRPRHLSSLQSMPLSDMKLSSQDSTLGNNLSSGTTLIVDVRELLPINSNYMT